MRPRRTSISSKLCSVPSWFVRLSPPPSIQAPKSFEFPVLKFPIVISKPWSSRDKIAPWMRKTVLLVLEAGNVTSRATNERWPRADSSFAESAHAATLIYETCSTCTSSRGRWFTNVRGTKRTDSTGKPNRHRVARVRASHVQRVTGRSVIGSCQYLSMSGNRVASDEP